MVSVSKQYSSSKIEVIAKKVEIKFFSAPKEKWNERTFFITITLFANNDSQVCDVIYLVDREKFTAGFSLNKNYIKVKKFFLKHFRHNLLYDDEIYFAKYLTTTKEFQAYFNEYSKIYPKNVSNFKSTL